MSGTKAKKRRPAWPKDGYLTTLPEDEQQAIIAAVLAYSADDGRSVYRAMHAAILTYNKVKEGVRQ